jgi:hypothetical protein
MKDWTVPGPPCRTWANSHDEGEAEAAGVKPQWIV